MIALFQSNQGRETLEFDRKLTESTTVRGDVGGKKDSLRKQRLGLG